jgi:hypothetical protein
MKLIMVKVKESLNEMGVLGTVIVIIAYKYKFRVRCTYWSLDLKYEQFGVLGLAVH